MFTKAWWHGIRFFIENCACLHNFTMLKFFTVHTNVRSRETRFWQKEVEHATGYSLLCTAKTGRSGSVA